MELRSLSNLELFERWRLELLFRYRTDRPRKEAYRVIGLFERYLEGRPPTAHLAKQYLSRFVHRSQNTRAGYYAQLTMFMSWYGDPIDDSSVSPEEKMPDRGGDLVSPRRDSTTIKLTAPRERSDTPFACLVFQMQKQQRNQDGQLTLKARFSRRYLRWLIKGMTDCCLAAHSFFAEILLTVSRIRAMKRSAFGSSSEAMIDRESMSGFFLCGVTPENMDARALLRS